MAQGRRQKECPRSKDWRPYITDGVMLAQAPAFDLFVYPDETCLKNTQKLDLSARKSKLSCDG